MPASDEWYADGLRFSCTQCGNCCTGGPGAVWFDEDEGRVLAARFGVSESEFLRRFARKIGRRWSLREHRTAHGFDCILLDRDAVPGKALCRAYEDRPRQCRTWPFWPENLESREAWDETKARVPCPGMGNGRLYSVEEIRVVREEEEEGEG